MIETILGKTFTRAPAPRVVIRVGTRRYGAADQARAMARRDGLRCEWTCPECGHGHSADPDASVIIGSACEGCS